MPNDDSHAFTRQLRRYAAGDRTALDGLLPAVYDELHGLARAIFRADPGSSLQPTMLIHEAYLKLAGSQPDLNDRQHFLALAARAMRQVVANHARDREALKRGGGWRRVTLVDSKAHDGGSDMDLVALHEALAELEAQAPRRAEVAQLRFFAGMTIDETAAALGIGTTTVEADWALARAWLRRRLAAAEGVED